MSLWVFHGSKKSCHCVPHCSEWRLEGINEAAADPGMELTGMMNLPGLASFEGCPPLKAVLLRTPWGSCVCENILSIVLRPMSTSSRPKERRQQHHGSFRLFLANPWKYRTVHEIFIIKHSLRLSAALSSLTACLLKKHRARMTFCSTGRIRTHKISDTLTSFFFPEQRHPDIVQELHGDWIDTEPTLWTIKYQLQLIFVDGACCWLSWVPEP